MNDYRPGKVSRALTTYGGYKTTRRAYFDQTNTTAVPWSEGAGAPDNGQTFEAERIRPARAPEIEADVLTPLFQSMGVVVFATLITGYGVLVFSNWPVHTACFSGLICGAVWFVYSMSMGRKTLWVSEYISHGSEPPQAAPVASPPMQLEVVQTNEHGNFRAMHRFNLPPELSEKIPVFAAGIIGGRGLAEASWTGSTGLFSRAEFAALMAALHQGGLVAWANPEAKAQGRVMTLAGLEAFRQLERLK